MEDGKHLLRVQGAVEWLVVDVPHALHNTPIRPSVRQFMCGRVGAQFIFCGKSSTSSVARSTWTTPSWPLEEALKKGNAPPQLAVAVTASAVAGSSPRLLVRLSGSPRSQHRATDACPWGFASVLFDDLGSSQSYTTLQGFCMSGLRQSPLPSSTRCSGASPC